MRWRKEFGVAVQQVDLRGGDYTVDHSAAVFLLNDARSGRHLHAAVRSHQALAADLRIRRAASASPMNAKLFVGMQYVLPQHLLTSLVYSVDAQPHAGGQELAHLQLRARTSSRT